MNSFKRNLAVMLAAALLTACAWNKPLVVPASPFATAPPTATADEQTQAAPVSAATATAEPATAEPRSPVQRMATSPREKISLGGNDLALRFSANDSIQLSANNLPVRELLSYVFGDLLKSTYVVADGLPGLDTRLTLNSAAPTNSRAIFRMTVEALDRIGIAVLERDGVIFFGPKSGRSGSNLPIGYGRRPVDVPQASGLILQIIPLRFGVNASIDRVAKDLGDLQATFDSAQSAFFVTGSRPSILRLLDLVRLLDQPSVAASNVGLITLTFVDSKSFTTQMLSLLEAEGITGGSGGGKSVNVVALDTLGAVVVFAASPEILKRVDFWASQIDRPAQGPSQQYFLYQPRYARATDLGESLAALLGAKTPTGNGNLTRDTRSALPPPPDGTQQNAMRRDSSSGGATGNVSPSSIDTEGMRIAIDPRSNSLVFYTSGPRYQALLPMIKRLDVSPKQIVLEATVAEVSLSGEFANGVEFAVSGSNGKWSGVGAPGLPAGGGLALRYVGGLAEDVRVRLTSGDSRVNVLSNPIVVVRDGVAASISVGNDVPTVGATASDPLQSSRQLTTVLYRKTGLNLSLRPTINSQGAVLLVIQQQISSTVPGSSGVDGAPIFFERSVQTEVVAKSGQSVLLAGLISENQSKSTTKVPFLGSIPGLGAVFRSDSRRNEKTELVLLITPRILEAEDQWGDVLGTIQQNLQYLDVTERLRKPSQAPLP